jgi:peptide/nickel transport system substrate-binding protein
MSLRLHDKFPVLTRVLALWVLLVFLPAGCAEKGKEDGDSGPESSSRQEGGTVVIALNEDPDVLNSLIRRSAIAGHVLDKIQDTLAEMGEDLEWHPLIASSWDIAEDRLSVTYHLKHWSWQDGTPLTARDVVSSFELLRNPAVGSPRRGQFRDVGQVAAVDSLTVVYTFGRPLPDPIARTFHTILPWHITRNLDPAEVMNWDINDAPLASGPFTLESWEHGRSLSLVPNPLFPLQRPLLDRVIFKVIPDAAGRVVSLETGEVDFVDNLNPVDARRLGEKGGVTIAPLGGRQYYYLNWNIRLPIFADPETRRALSLAIDRQRMIDTLLLGYAQAAVGPLPPVMWNFNKALAADPHDPERSRRILAQAGWADADGDGVLERDGHKLSFEILTKLGDPVRENGSTIIRENLREVGAEVQVRVLELATGLELLQKGQFEAYFGSFNSNLYGDPSSVVHSRSTEEYNKGGYANAAVDSLLEVALALTDRAQALPVWAHLQAVLQEDQPSAYLFYPQRLVGYNPRLRDVRPHLLSPYNNLAEWWIATSDRKYRSGN